MFLATPSCGEVFLFGLINYIELCEIRNHDPALILIFIISLRDMFFVLSFGIFHLEFGMEHL